MNGPASDIHLSVVVPAYNEEEIIAETVRRITAFNRLKGWTWELIVSSDGSTDGTDRIVSSLAAADPHVRLLTTSVNRGKGATAKTGALAARGRYVLITDADLSSPVKESDKLLAALERGADIAIGSRALRSPGADVQQSVKRRLAGRVFNRLVSFLVVRGLRDTQCGFKCFTKDAVARIFPDLTLNGFGFDVEILLLAGLRGLRVREVPVMWREGRQSKIRLYRDSARMFGELFELRRRYRARFPVAVVSD